MKKPVTVLHEDRRQTIKLPHFNYTVEVSYTEDFKRYALKRGWKKFYEQIKDDERSVTGYHGKNPEYCQSWIMFGPDPSIKTIAHEVFHTVWNIMKHIGAEFENEVMAYHMGYLVQEITENLYKYGPTYEEVRQLNKKPKRKKSS